jgi:glc operon protein GlcG
MALSLAEANLAIAGAIKKAQDLNIRVCVAVCDGGGRLLAFNRMDGAIWGAVYGSQGKAVASAAMGRPSGALDPTRVIFQKIGEHEGGHMIASQGAVPIVRNGVVEGACGVGGGTGEQDEECAAAGAAAL